MGKSPILAAKEKEIEQAIIDGLRLLGYTVLQAGTRGARPQEGKGFGGSKGVPDLQVRGKGWPVGVSVQLEVKRTHLSRFSSKEQEDYWKEGGSFRVTKWEEAVYAVACAEHVLRLEGPAFRQWRDHQSAVPLGLNTVVYSYLEETVLGRRA